MEEHNINRQIKTTGNNSIIFGTSSDDIEEGLHNGQFIDASETGSVDDKDQIVNEQEQNEIVNPSEETFNEEIISQPAASDHTAVAHVAPRSVELEENVIDLDPDEETIDNSGNISKAED